MALRKNHLGHFAFIILSAGAMLSPQFVHAQSSLIRRMEITELDVSYTSGTMILQEIHSAHAIVSQDGESVITDEMSVTVNPLQEDMDAVRIQSPYGRYYFAATPGPQIPPKADLVARLRTLKESDTLNAPAPALIDPVRGDILLKSTDEADPVQMNIGERGGLSAHMLFWSEELQKFLSLGMFEQNTVMPDGQVAITGDAFITDQQFHEWVYPVMTANTPLVLRFEPDPGAPSSGEGFLGSLSGGGEVTMTTRTFVSGQNGLFHMGIVPSTGEQIFNARGRVELQAPELTLGAEALQFQPAEDTLKATGNVSIATPQVDASADRLTYYLQQNAFSLHGSPRVVQQSDQSRSSFSGMNEFTMNELDDGRRRVVLSGDNEIVVDMQTTEAEATQETPSQETDAFGANMNLRVTPRGTEQPPIVSTINPEGELVNFTAVGSVILTNDQMRLRADRLVYDVADQTMTASGNIYLEQATFKVEADELAYDLQTGRMALSGAPEITREEANGITRISGCDSVIVEPREGGNPDITGLGDGCRTSFTPTPPAGDEHSTQGDTGFFGQFQGAVLLTTGRRATGEPGYFKITHDPQTGEQLFVAEGELNLETEEFNLRSARIEFRESQRKLSAINNVKVRTPQIEATADNMEYNTATGEVLLTGNPDVLQTTAQNRAHFIGMNSFAINQNQAGARELQITGSDPINIDIKPVDSESTSSPAPADMGLSRLGETLNIVVSPRPERDPLVRSTVNPEGALEVFSASGSVVMKSNQFDIRADELTYNAPQERFEATGNVYVKQQNIEADSGHLLYDLKTGRIILTVDPQVVRYEAERITTTIGCDEVIMQPRENASPDVTTMGENCRTSSTPVEKPAPEQTEPSTEPIEITTDEPQAPSS